MIFNINFISHFFTFFFVTHADCGFLFVKFYFYLRIFLRSYYIFSRKFVSFSTIFMFLLCYSVFTALFRYIYCPVGVFMFISANDNSSADFLLRILFFLSFATPVDIFIFGLFGTSQLPNLR